MNVENDTPFEMRFVCDVTSDDVARVDALTRVAWTLESDAPILAMDESATDWPSLAAPLDLGYVQLTVEGRVTAGGVPFKSRDAVLAVDDQVSRLRAFGPRRWVRIAGRLTASAPTPVAGVEMSWSAAYGGSFKRAPGVVRGTGLPGPSTVECWPQNPAGTGFYVTEAEAEGGLLPSLEDPDALIDAWDERPGPKCWARLPADSSLRLDHVVKSGDLISTGGAPGRSPLLDAQAGSPPGLRLPELQAGSPIRLDGMSAKPIVFRVPQVPFQWRLTSGDRVRWAPAKLWSLVIDADRGLLIGFYRTAGLLPLIRREPRSAAQVMVEA